MDKRHLSERQKLIWEDKKEISVIQYFQAKEQRAPLQVKKINMFSLVWNLLKITVKFNRKYKKNQLTIDM